MNYLNEALGFIAICLAVWGMDQLWQSFRRAMIAAADRRRKS